ncbi:hypothetical protein BaRGS_00038711, partial [Batillaria attramentaria]
MRYPVNDSGFSTQVPDQTDSDTEVRFRLQKLIHLVIYLTFAVLFRAVTLLNRLGVGPGDRITRPIVFR